jgi:hypothetical protein
MRVAPLKRLLPRLRAQPAHAIGPIRMVSSMKYGSEAARPRHARGPKASTLGEGREASGLELAAAWRHAPHVRSIQPV